MKIPKNNNLGINVKGIIGKTLCKHKNQQQFVYNSPDKYFITHGEKRYCICKDCGKTMYDYFAEYEGNGFK